MKKLSSILCVMLLMAVGLWRAYEDSFNRKTYNTVAAETLSAMMVDIPQMTPKEVAKPLDSVKIEADTMPAKISKQDTTKLTANLSDVKPIKQKKSKVVRQGHTSSPKKVEAGPTKVSTDSAAYYGKRILAAIDSLDKKVSTPCDTCGSR